MKLMALSGPKTVTLGWSSLPCCLIVHLTEYSTVPSWYYTCILISQPDWLYLARGYVLGYPGMYPTIYLPPMILSVSTCQSCLIQSIIARSSANQMHCPLQGGLLVYSWSLPASLGLRLSQWIYCVLPLHVLTPGGCVDYWHTCTGFAWVMLDIQYDIDTMNESVKRCT